MHLPKVDLHVHLEGTLTPATARRLAARNDLPVPEGLIRADDTYDIGSGGLVPFLHAYDRATALMKTAQDYTDITCDYLSGVAAEGCIYAEITISADHGAMIGLTYPHMVEAIAAGAEKAKRETGIEARLISSCVRHYGIEKAMHVARLTRDNPHPLVTAFGMAGDENAFTPADFAPAFALSGLPHRTAHAGEAAGPQSIRAAKAALGVKRFGHMVRAIEDESLMEELIAYGAIPEVCPSSNIVLGIFKDYASHPLRVFFDRGLKVTLGSDDPSFFGTTIGREYQIARDHFGFTEQELLHVTRNALEAAFLDAETRARLFQRNPDL